MDAATQVRTREAKAFAHIAEANRLRAIYTQNPAHAEVPETRRLEARALIEAARAGDATQEQRLTALIETVRHDAKLPEAKRCEIIGLRRYQQAGLGRIKNEQERFAVIERIERSLIAEFPTAPNGYEALYRLALHCDDAKGKALAEELVRMPKAPDFVKVASRELLERYAIAGKPLVELLPVAVRRGNSNTSGLPTTDADSPSSEPAETVLYCWTSANRGSIAFARFLQDHAPPGIRRIGVCLDKDEAAGREAAQASGLRDQLYDSTGDLASRLKFDGAPLAIIAGPDGVIYTVCGVRELTRRFATARSANSQPTEGR